MSCTVQIYSPKTGEYIVSNLWNQINNEVQNSELADKLFAQTRTEAFLAWFGNPYVQGESHSQVVTENNEPLLVYHASTINFDSFNLEKSRELGFHFGTQEAALDRFSSGKMVLFDGEESTITEIPITERKKKLTDNNIVIKPYFLNIRNMIEGVDNMDYNPDGFSQEDSILKNYLDESTELSNDFKILTLAFYQKGLINYDDVENILGPRFSLLTGEKATGQYGLRKALGNLDGYWYINQKEDKGQKSYVVFDPKNIKSLYNNGNYSESENTMFSLNSDTSVDFTLKVINALQKTTRKVYPSNNVQGFYNDLIKQGAPKNQIDLLKQHVQNNNITEINTNDLIVSLLSEMNYVVEINTAKATHNIKPEESEFYTDSGIISQQKGNPTQYYSNLTVPGGTNYTENEIATPLITPSIKGHTQFSTDNGIGWFRCDEQVEGANQIREENLKKKAQLIDLWGKNEKYKELLSGDISVYNDRNTGVANSYGGVLIDNTTGKKYDLHFDDLEPLLNNTSNEILDRQEGGINTKTRRILEVQSDIFQKSRDIKSPDEIIEQLKKEGKLKVEC